jgi:DnaK suppressor protein
MDKALIALLEEKLKKEKENLEKRLNKFSQKDKKPEGDWDTRYPQFNGGGLEEEADEVEEYTNLLPVEHALELELEKVNKALKKIKLGSYGICKRCGKPISRKRLEAYPQAEYCQECQEKK